MSLPRRLALSSGGVPLSLEGVEMQRCFCWTFRGQGWGTESLEWMGQTCTEKLRAEEGGRRQPPACAPV